ncbi:MAG: flavin reductase family protein [Pseudomonadota bacterium]
MFYNAIENNHGLKHDPFKALIAPRPIGWISTVSPAGILNLAPYSFFNAVSDNPHYVMFSSGGRKDSITNAEQTGEFVCSLATYDLRNQMNMTSKPVHSDINEMEMAGLTPAPSQMVIPPRVQESPVAFECKYYTTVDLPHKAGELSYHIVIGQVVGIYIADMAIADSKVDITKLKPIARLGYKDYSVVDSTFELDRPKQGSVLEQI